ncbi:MAG: hypothetical protein HGN29_03300 [Asgard group archaeon]|nr:hypothetical protein [Asgard group archaeon]
MNKRNICIISTSILFLLVLVNIPALNAVTYERGWKVGTAMEYSWEGIERDSVEATNDTTYVIYEFKMQALVRINITEIDELNKEVTEVQTVVGGYSGESVKDFDADYISNELASSLFDFYYYWDYNFNRAILTSFSIGLYGFLPNFLEPDWTTFNENFVTIIDENQTIAAIDTGYEIQYIYLSDFLEKVSFLINGKENLIEAKNSFTSDTSKWIFVFEVSEYILDRDYNYDEDIYEYFEYDKYEVKFELEYTKGGILTEMRISSYSSITKDNVKHIYEEYYSFVEGDKGTSSISYNLLSALVVLVLLPVLLHFKRKKN